MKLSTSATLCAVASSVDMRLLEQLFDHTPDIAFFIKDRAGRYVIVNDSLVERQDSEGRKRMDRAYALTNPQEYFAENTEAFFTHNDFYPYTRDQLKEHDPEMFALLEKLWNPPPK